ncbi:tetraspanin-8-like [Lates japonicus]|uniref:Tetraspanin-8-like protein n=1 Tax=Lates japonicus TaxID=270547 RepID=A0AAD3RAD6_LATJO|nr:tetraspanin-8-like protein [Lates japonicus]
MGKVNVCLKRSYITVASLIGIISTLLLAITLFSHGYLHGQEEFSPQTVTGLRGMYGLSLVPLLLTIVGLFGACKMKKWALILFTVGMILISLYMFVSESIALAMRPEVTRQLRRQYLEVGLLANASESFTSRLSEAQTDLQCCGLDQGYVDWGYNIPETCLCTEYSTNPCVAAPRASALFEDRSLAQPIMIYKEPCLPYLIAEEMFYINTVLGVMLGYTFLWVLSIVLCISILCQLNRKEDTPTVVYSPEAKAGNYTTLTEPAEDT